MEIGSAVAADLAMALDGDIAAACAREAAGPAEDDELPLRSRGRRAETVKRPVPEVEGVDLRLPSPPRTGSRG